MTVKKAKKIAITIGIIINVLVQILLSRCRIQNLGELSVDGIFIICFLGLSGFIILAVYFILYDIWIRNLIRKEDEKAHLKKVNEFIDKLKNSSNGEKKISQKCIIYNNTESHILSKIVEAYNPIYSAKIKEDDKIEVIVRDRKSNEMICPPINVDDFDYLISHFEFAEEFQDYEK